MSNNQPNSRSHRTEGEISHGRGAPLVYAGAAFIAALAFWAVTTFTGSYPAVARFGGAMWIFVLMMIVLMPIVIPRVNKRQRGRQEPIMKPEFDEETGDA